MPRGEVELDREIPIEQNSLVFFARPPPKTPGGGYLACGPAFKRVHPPPGGRGHSQPSPKLLPLKLRTAGKQLDNNLGCSRRSVGSVTRATIPVSDTNSSGPLLANQNQPHIHDIGIRRTSHQQIPQRLKKMI